ncbi:MAG: DUF4159 domain-containing protein [Myxococcota bacterium]
MSLSRRGFVGSCLAAVSAGLIPSRAHALSPGPSVRLIRLSHRGDPWMHPAGVDELAREIGLRTSVDIAERALTLSATDPKMATNPMAILTGAGAVRFSAAEREALRRWLELGGLLWIDNAGQSEASAAFDTSVRRELAAILPGSSFARISPEHVLYRSFYRLDYAAGRVIRRPYVEGISVGRRIAVVLTHNDAFAAFARGANGRFVTRPAPGGENQREMAFRFGVNAVLYGLCLHYKDDQVHVDYLLHRRKWKIRRPEP